MSDIKRIIAEELLRIRAVFLRPEEPFTWASGIKSPIYCDNRLILTDVKARNIVEKALADMIQNEYPEAELIMGTATAGISHAAIAAHILSLPMGYVRSSNKNHGRQNLIEGKIIKKQKTVVVEDLISTGGSSIEVVEKLREAGLIVLGIASIFTYETEKSKKKLSDANVKNISLTDFDSVIKTALKMKYINESDMKGLLEFRNNLK